MSLLDEFGHLADAMIADNGGSAFAFSHTGDGSAEVALDGSLLEAYTIAASGPSPPVGLDWPIGLLRDANAAGLGILLNLAIQDGLLPLADRIRSLAAWFRRERTAGPDDLEFYASWILGKPGRGKLASLPYDEFLRTPYWRCVREVVLARDEHECRLCGETKRLQVHHRTYEHRGHEHAHLGDLITLCAPCHARHHRVAVPHGGVNA